MSVNRVIILGKLGADPELKYTPNQTAVCNLRIATSEVSKGKDGQRHEKTEWHRVTVWGDQGANCSQYLAKGRQVYVEGRLQTRSWEKNGEKRYSTDIVADRVVFLGSGERTEQAGAARASGPVTAPPESDDIPF